MRKPLRRFRQLGNRGDTIVEVLIVLAVLGLAMSIAYATANKGLQQSRNAQEHSQALGLINSQVELLRSAFANDAGTGIERMSTPPPAKPFCLSADNTPGNPGVKVNPIRVTGPHIFDEALANDRLNADAYTAVCNQDTLYYVSVIGRGNNVYDFRVRWEGLGNLGLQQEEITYKQGNATLVGVGGYTGPGAVVTAPPELSLTLNAPASVNAGENATLEWSTTPQATSCTLESSLSPGVVSGNVGASGTKTFVAPDIASPTLDWTMNCTRPGSEPVSKTVTIQVLKTFKFKGNEFASCSPSNGTACSIVGTSVFSCVEYEATYEAKKHAVEAGNYNLALYYSNPLSGGCLDGTFNPPPANYKFHVEITVSHPVKRSNGKTVMIIDRLKTVDLPWSQGSETIDIGALNTDSVISITWTNDDYVVDGRKDPNFQINRFTLIHN